MSDHSTSLKLKLKHNLSTLDRMILKEILSNNERITSDFISKKIGIPLTTIQSRRRRLEKEFFEKKEDFFHLEKFGWRRVDFFISTISGKTDSVARELLALKQVISVRKCIGQHTIDLRAEAIVKDNGQILDLMEGMEAMDGIKDVVWSEIVKAVGKKNSVPSHIVDLL
jgi:DNA-binding Lrp family transcriptional regulator